MNTLHLILLALLAADTNQVQTSTNQTSDAILSGVKRGQMLEERTILLGVVVQKTNGWLYLDSGRNAKGDFIYPRIVKPSTRTAIIKPFRGWAAIKDHPKYDTMALGGYVEVVGYPIGSKLTINKDGNQKYTHFFTVSLDKAAEWAANKILEK